MKRVLETLKTLMGDGKPPPEVRPQAWGLGCRHGGRVLEGAREELNAPDITARRAVLLKAVIRSLK
ncbi:MAG: hypothetical protein P4L64_06455 [Caulobacteraceae bacterium]|nr:hypothetical protein [Caulobacteraceae bacterium]